MRLVVLTALILGIGGLAGLAALDHREAPRFGLIGDPVVGYRLRPSITDDGFSTNALSMRSRPAPSADDGCTLRIMIFGDSVVFGGGLRNDELATTRLERALEERIGRPVWVGNAATGGWSPNNVRGFIERFGWLQADMTAFVLNSHDIDQSLAIDPLIEEGTPLPVYRLSLADRTKRWLLTFAPYGWLPAEPDPYTPEEGAPEAESVLAWLFDEAAGLGPVFVFHNRVVGELETHDRVSEHARRARRRAPRLVSLARRHDVGYRDLGPAMAAASDAYSDHIHLTAAGQKVMADMMIEALAGPAAAIANKKLINC